MKRLLMLLSAGMIAAACQSACADPPSVALTYPAPNSVINLAATPVVRLQVSVSDPDDSIVAVTYLVCLGDCSRSPAVAAGFSTAPPYDFSWRPGFVLATGELATYTVWAEATNASGQSAASNIVAFLVDQPPLPTGMLVAPAPSLRHGFVLPAAPTFYVQAAPMPSTTIARVDFLDDGEAIGTVPAPNAMPSGYAFVWHDPPAGEHLVSARVTDSEGHSAISPPVSIYIREADEPPRVALISPTTGQIYTSGDAVPLAATATSSEGSIERVEFRMGDTVIGSARSVPYTTTWGGPPPGDLAIVAVAYDELGVASLSAAAHIQVLDVPRRPAVVLTAPAPGSTVSAASPLDVAADALSPDGSISRVDFYAGTTFLGSAARAPYTIAWPNPQVGAQSLTAKAYDARNVATTSAPVGVTVTSSLVPTVSLTAPASGAAFNAPASIAISADAKESGGSIVKVDFYANGAAIGSKGAAPYSITWSNILAGGYTLSAKVTDGAGATAVSTSVPITVYPPSPTITLAGQSAGNTFAPGQPIVLSAQATTPGSTISKVEFDADGVSIGTVTASPGASSGSFALTWNAAAAGTHALSAKVFAASGAIATSNEVVVSVADLAVTLLEPAAGQVFQSSTPIPLAAHPSETGATIARVEFYADGALVATSSAPPYSAAWSGAGVGSHSVTAKVIDTRGLTTASPAVTVTVIATQTIQVDGGIDGVTVDDDYVSISGRIQAPLNSAVAINGRGAVLDLNGRFFIDDFKLQPGANAVSLTLNAQGLAPILKTINLTSIGAAPFEVTLDKQEGLAPLTTGLSIRNRGNVAFKRITVDITDDGVTDFVLTALPSGGAAQSITYGAPGLYTLRVIAYDTNDSPIYTTTRRVRAIDPSEIGYKVASVYTTLVNSLAASNVNGALTAFVDGARDRYAGVFADLGTALPTIAALLGSLSNISLNEDFAELTVARSVGSDTQLFMIYLIRGNDGLWRIETM